jgi:hypothetical protein
MNTTHNLAAFDPTDSRPRLWMGRVLTGLPMALLGFDGLMKVMSVPEVVEASGKLGFGPSTLRVLGMIEIVSLLLAMSRRTRIFSAVLVTAYLGGAVCTHVRQGDPLFTHVLAPIYVAVAIWGGLYLRDERVRAISPFTSQS